MNRLAFLRNTILCAALLPAFVAAAPEPPRNFRAFYGGNPDYPRASSDASDVTLTWECPAPDAQTKWVLLKKNWGEKNWTRLAPPAPGATQYVDKGALAGTPSVYYQLAASDASGLSRYASVTAWRLKRNYPGTPSWSWPKTEIWMSNQPGASRSLSVTEGGESRLCLKDIAQWPGLAGEIDGIVLYYSTIKEAGIEELRAFARALEANPKRNRIKLGIEIGVFDGSALRSGTPQGSMAAVESFHAQLRVLRKYTDPADKGGAGGVIDLFFMDGPIHRAVFPPGGDGPFTIATASEQVVRWMEFFREVYPEIKYNLICNFSSWAYAGTPARNTRARARGADGFGDYDTVIDTLFPLADARGVPFEGLTTDYAYDGFNNEGPTDQPEIVRGQDFRARLRALRDKVTSLKLGPGGASLRFGMLCNTSRGTSAGNYATRVELFNYLEEINALGIVPDRITVQSWIKYPDRWLPETRKDTMTNITARILQRLRHQRDISQDNTP